MLVNKMIQMILIVLAIYLQGTQAVVQFSFNRGDLAISEGGNLPSQISILKSGEINQTITFQVRVIPGTARENEDYISNSGATYMFTNDTNQLQIRTELAGDRAGEPIENFRICLPDSQVLEPMGAEAVQPTCVTITIVDDDSVVIGFKNSLEGAVEGGTKTICVEVKPEGLRLDPFDRVPLTIRVNSSSSGVQLNTNSLVFEMSVSEKCASISVADSDSMNMGNRTYSLILERSGMSTVPVELYPNTIPLIVIDDDTQEPDTNFSLISPEPVIEVLEGGRRINEIQVQKLGSTLLSYVVTLMVTSLTNSDRSNDVRVITNNLIFNPSTTHMNVEVEVIEDTMPEKRGEFSISIGRITTLGAPNVNLSTVVGGPVTIIVYDNDFEIGFTADEFSIQEGSRNRSVCVAIINPEESSDIEPSLSIPITIVLENTTFKSLVLDRRDILLNATNKIVCLVVNHTTDNDDCDAPRSYPIQLNWTESQDYTIYFRQQNPNITIVDSQDCSRRGTASLGSGEIAAIIVILIIVAGVIVAIIVTVLIVKVRRKEKKDNLQENPIQMKGISSNSTPSLSHDEVQSRSSPASNNGNRDKGTNQDIVKPEPNSDGEKQPETIKQPCSPPQPSGQQIGTSNFPTSELERQNLDGGNSLTEDSNSSPLVTSVDSKKETENGNAMV